jgi:hypothetical protein
MIPRSTPGSANGIWNAGRRAELDIDPGREPSLSGRDPDTSPAPQSAS